MKKTRKKYAGKVIKSICTGIIVTGAALILSVPQTAMSAVEKDNSIANGWHHGFAYIAEQEIRSNNPGESNNTYLSRLFFSDEKHVYDIIKKLFQPEDKMYLEK